MFSTNKSVCDILHTNTSSQEAQELDKLVQPHASYIILCQSLIEGILPALMSLFLGPWSDKYGRKPLLVYAYLGKILISLYLSAVIIRWLIIYHSTGPMFRYTLLSVLSHWDVNPWLFMIAAIPPALFSGIAGLMLATFCYISDITNDTNRAWHLAWLNGCTSAGMVLGTVRCFIYLFNV